jgi:hypothetical protein
MIASLTFTYGDERAKVYEFKAKDKLDKIFRNSFDFNLYVFHNSTDSFIKKIKDSKLLSGFNFTFASAIGPWPIAFRQALQILKQKGIERFVFMEDDVFSVTKREDVIVELAEFLKTTDINYLNLEYNSSDLSEQILSRNIIEKKKTFKVFDTDTFFFNSIPLWSFDHSPYFCNLDFAINEFYPQIIENYNDIWSVEWFLKHKYDQINMPRYITDQKLFRRINFVGRNNWDKENELNFLEKKFLNN